MSVAAIYRVSEPSSCSQWNGIHAYVYLSDGEVIEAKERVDTILQQIAAEEGEA
ncbi:hypothetical protein [Aeromonas sp. QDB54]|uniref:hypothetical protein n=1 Tax=Aeromonas sp. QDB54 TaxID=2989826 RepID=UPI0022E54FB3|nr:hypothetical protein [Aeromonas sp. QDB54]